MKDCISIYFTRDTNLFQNKFISGQSVLKQQVFWNLYKSNLFENMKKKIDNQTYTPLPLS